MKKSVKSMKTNGLEFRIIEHVCKLDENNRLVTKQAKQGNIQNSLESPKKRMIRHLERILMDF